MDNQSSHEKQQRDIERILVIHDNPGSQEAVRRILEQAGYDVTVAPSSPNVMDIFLTTKPALVILDICLPGTSTQSLCRQIRDRSKNVSLLVLSVISDVEEVVLLLKLGADGYITKPFSPLEFVARIRAAIRSRESW